MDAAELSLNTTRMIARIDGPVGWMVFNNPERRNAVSMEMWEAVPTILGHFEADPAIKVIALAGAGDKAFVSGADISQFEKRRSSAEQVADYERTGQTASKALKECRKPTIAVIRGFCIGGGLGIAANCDLRFASDNAKFGVPAGRLGLGYAHAGVKTLMDIVGPAYTKEIFFTARHFTALEAAAMGFINRVVPDAELETFAAAQCAMIADNAPLTLHALKQTVGQLVRGSAADLELCRQLVADCFASEDYKEGRRAFMEKRKPVFTGR